MTNSNGRDSRGRFTKGNREGVKGARVTNEKYRDLLPEWGRKGYEQTVAKYFNGDEVAANEWLAQKGQAVQDQLNGYDQFFFTFQDPGPHPAHKNGNGSQ